MLNYRRNRSYSNSTPASCAVSIFGLGVALILGGIILMVITKNSKNNDEQASTETGEPKDKGSYDHVTTHGRHRKSKVNNIMKTLGPILLGVGITIIVLFFLACTVVGCGKELRASPAATTYMSPTVDRPQSNPSAPSYEHNTPSSGWSDQMSKTPFPQYSEHSAARDGLQMSLLPPPPSYDEINAEQRFGGCSSGGNVTLKPVSS